MALLRAELIELVTKIGESQGTDDEIVAWLDLVIKETGCPDVGAFIFYSEPEMTTGEVADKILSYKPTRL